MEQFTLSSEQKTRDEAIRVKNALTALTHSEGWDIIAKTLLEQANARENKLLGPITALHQVLENEYLRGEKDAIQTLRLLPKALLGEAQNVLDLYKKPEEGTE